MIQFLDIKNKFMATRNVGSFYFIKTTTWNTFFHFFDNFPTVKFMFPLLTCSFISNRVFNEFPVCVWGIWWGRWNIPSCWRILTFCCFWRVQRYKDKYLPDHNPKTRLSALKRLFLNARSQLPDRYTLQSCVRAPSCEER